MQINEQNVFVCSDIDECGDRVLACHGLDEICVNTEGSFRCQCAEGFFRKDSVCLRKQLPSESNVDFFTLKHLG